MRKKQSAEKFRKFRFFELNYAKNIARAVKKLYELSHMGPPENRAHPQSNGINSTQKLRHGLWKKIYLTLILYLTFSFDRLRSS